jgi:hypothetical protein
MKSKYVAVAVAFGFFVAAGSSSVHAQGKGHGNGKGEEKHEEKAEHGNGHGNGRGHARPAKYDREFDHDGVHGWYVENRGHLPPGLAKREQLPPGLRRQLVVRGTLPPGLQARIEPVPAELEVRMSPAPPNCEHVLVGGNVVLLNRRSNLVIDVVAVF